MPYQGAELQAYLCNKWAKENGYLHDHNGDALISTANGYRVTVPLPDDNTDVLVTHDKANGIIKIDKRKTSMPSPYGKRKRCKTVEEAIVELMSAPDSKPPRKSKAKDTAVPCENVITQDTPCNCLPRNKAVALTDKDETKSNPTDNGFDIVPDSKYTGEYNLIAGEGGKLNRVRVGGDDAGIVDGWCQDYETARANFMAFKEKCSNSCDFTKTCAIALGTYIKQPFDDVKNAVSRMVKRYLFNIYTNLKCVFAFHEPYECGGWHCHLIMCFYDEFPHGLYECVLKSWKNRIIIPEETYKTDKHLVDLRYFYTYDEFINCLDYLNPVSKKKRDRLKFYPRGRNARQAYGDYCKSKKLIMPASEAKKLVGNEHIALRHEVKILNASATVFNQTEDLRLHNFTYYFEKNMDVWNAISAKGKVADNKSCDTDVTPPVTAPHEAVTSVSCDYNYEDERDNSRWSDYVYEHFTMMYLRC